MLKILLACQIIIMQDYRIFVWILPPRSYPPGTCQEDAILHYDKNSPEADAEETVFLEFTVEEKVFSCMIFQPLMRDHSPERAGPWWIG
jgi:hypothetical protein